MSNFEPAIAYVLENEGGYVNNSKDPGGATNFGITQKSWLDVNIQTITKQDAIGWYLAHYWNTARWGAIENQQVCTKLLDTAVNCGTRTAIILAQHVLNFRNGDVDGDLGPKTIGAINRDDAAAFLQDFVSAIMLRYKLLEQHNSALIVFDKGWMNRAKKLPPVQVVLGPVAVAG